MGRHNVQEKAPQELLSPKLHDLGGGTGRIVFITETDNTVTDEDQLCIGDNYSVGVTAEVLQHRLRATEGSFGVNHPGGAVKLLEEDSPGIVIS